MQGAIRSSFGSCAVMLAESMHGVREEGSFLTYTHQKERKHVIIGPAQDFLLSARHKREKVKLQEQGIALTCLWNKGHYWLGNLQVPSLACFPLSLRPTL